MDEANGRVIIHRAVRATSSTRSWSRVELVVVTYIRSAKIFVAAYASDANPYFRQPSSPLAQFTQEVHTLGQAASLSKKCIEDPCSILPISKIENSYRRDRLSEQLETIEVDAEVDGSASSLPPWPAAAELARTGKLKITLALGQSLAEAMENGGSVSEDLKKTLRYYLEYVPLVVGHWGSFKHLFKILEGRSDTQALYGLALARIDSGVISPTTQSSQIEDLSFLSPLFQSPVASRATLSYLARRGRRVVRRLSDSEPQTYARCVRMFLLSVDALGGHLGISNRRILAEVIYGRGVSDTSHGRGAIDLPPVPQRYRRRWDRAPNVWNTHLEWVAHLWASCKTASDIQIWAFNVLKSQKAEIPKLSAAGLRLALVSPKNVVRNQACSQISDFPLQFLRLDASSAVAFLNFCSGKKFRSVFEVLEAHPASKVVRESIPLFLNDHGLTNILIGEEPSRISPKAEKLLGFTFRHLQDTLTEIGALNLGLFIGRTNGFRPASLWRKSFKSLPIKTLVELRLQLTDLSASAKKIIDDACYVAVRANADENLAMALVHSPTAALRELAWSILASDSIASDTQLATWQSLLDFAKTKDGQLRLRQCVLDRHRFSTLTGHPNCAPILSQIAIALAHAEHAASKRALYALAEIGDPAAILEALNTIAETCPSWPWEQEQPLLRTLIVKTEGVRELLWQGLSEGQYEQLVHKLSRAHPIIKTFYDVIRPEGVVSIVPAQARILSNLLAIDPSRLVRSRDLSIAAATCPASEVASTAITILEARDKIKAIFLPLLESRLPIAMRAARRHLETLTNKSALTKAIISVCDSGITEAREYGLTMLRERQGEYDAIAVYSALAEHKSPDVAAEVARYTLGDGQIRASAIKNFDQRILRTRRQGRRAKELVKVRLERVSKSNVYSIDNKADAAAERIDSLMAMARGRSQRDREWALRELVRMSELGLEIPLLEVSKTTT